MDIAEARAKLLALIPDADIPAAAPGDDLYAFAFAGRAFAPPFLAALAGGPGAGAAPALAALLEEVIATGDDGLVDGFAMRVLHSGLLRRPDLLAAAWPGLGPQTRALIGRFQALEEECADREAAARGG